MASPQPVARDFQLTRPPADFIDDPYPYYGWLREHDPVRDRRVRFRGFRNLPVRIA